MRVVKSSEATNSRKGEIDQVIADADYTVVAMRDARCAGCCGAVVGHVQWVDGDRAPAEVASECSAFGALY